MVGSMILDLAYGIDVQSQEDPYLMMMDELMDIFVKVSTPGAFLVDIIPARASLITSTVAVGKAHGISVKYVPGWFPGAGFKRVAKEWKKVIKGAADVPFQYAKDEMVDYSRYTC